MRKTTKRLVPRALVALLLASGLAMAAAQPAGATSGLDLTSATVQARGVALEITYTVTCEAGGYAYANTSVNQRSGSELAAGYGYAQVACTGEPQTLTMTAVASGAPFRPGDALFTTSATICDAFGFCEYTTEQEIFRITRT
jgi:hypothetical protein